MRPKAKVSAEARENLEDTYHEARAELQVEARTPGATQTAARE